MTGWLVGYQTAVPATVKAEYASAKARLAATREQLKSIEKEVVLVHAEYKLFLDGGGKDTAILRDELGDLDTNLQALRVRLSLSL